MSVALILILVLAASSIPSALSVCNTCHLRYHHKEVSSPTTFNTTASACARYAQSSCCTANTAEKYAQWLTVMTYRITLLINVGSNTLLICISSVCMFEIITNSVHNDKLYGSSYRWDRCGALSPKCQQWFVDEACLYECDVNSGKFRKHRYAALSQESLQGVQI